MRFCRRGTDVRKLMLSSMRLRPVRIITCWNTRRSSTHSLELVTAAGGRGRENGGGEGEGRRGEEEGGREKGEERKGSVERKRSEVRRGRGGGGREIRGRSNKKRRL